MTAPVNVKLENPTIDVNDWKFQAAQWKELNTDLGNRDFFPLTIKAFYVIGVIYILCQSVDILLKHSNAVNVTFLPAYGVFASGIELLGRCLRGENKNWQNVNNLKKGYLWLSDCQDKNQHIDKKILIRTSKGSYSIDDLIALRHFSAHGQATINEKKEGESILKSMDLEILSSMPSLLAPALGKYWSDLIQKEEFCNQLAKADIIVLRKWPVFQSLKLFEMDEKGIYHSVTERFEEFHWQF